MIFQNGDRIVFCGDSITDMGRAQPVGEGLLSDGLGRGYVSLVHSMIAVNYPELLVRVTNAGISGNCSINLLQRFERDCIALNPEWISICIGINDVWRQFDLPELPDSAVQLEAYETYMEEMIQTSKGVSNLKGIFILTPYYIEPNKQDKCRARMDEYGAVCKKLAKKYGCILVDFQKMYDDYCQYRHSSYLAWDRVHPTQTGSLLMAKEFLKHCDFDFHR